ncbi:MAG: esterase-like activity of phytase family protein [Methylococcales bacterium]
MKKTLIPLLLLPIFGAPSAQAAVELIAIGRIDPSYQDLSTRTAGPLESGVPGNMLGSLGSGLAYAGDNIFIAIPDRGPNATPYDPAIDDTTSYINRFQTLNLSLAANPDYDSLVVGSLPYILSPFLTATTLLSSTLPLSYGVDGEPALNTVNKYYFTGRSDNFNPARQSINPFHGRFDPEGVRVSNDGKSVFISDEYGPYVYQFKRTTGKRMKAFKLPDYFAVTHLRAFEKGPDGEIAVNTVGRTTNKGMEGLAITSNGKTLVGSMQTQLLQDEKKYVRIVTINIETGATHEYAYLLTDGSGVSEIVAINNHEFLVDERDGKGLGDGSSAVVKKLFKIDLTGAADISGTVSIGTGTPTVAKTLFLDVVAELTANGISATNIPAKIEGVAFGPDILIEGANKHTLFVANDNDFLATVNGVNNPNQFFVFSIDESDLPTFLQQNVAPFVLDDHDRG